MDANAQIKEINREKSMETRMKNIGLRGVKVADTKISHVDGENGILIYRGYRIEELAHTLRSKRRPISCTMTACRRRKSLRSFHSAHRSAAGP